MRFFDFGIEYVRRYYLDGRNEITGFDVEKKKQLFLYMEKGSLFFDVQVRYLRFYWLVMGDVIFRKLYNKV